MAPQYSQFVPQDTAKLIELQGGPEKFVDRLDFIFDQVGPHCDSNLQGKYR